MKKLIIFAVLIIGYTYPSISQVGEFRGLQPFKMIVTAHYDEEKKTYYKESVKDTSGVLFYSSSQFCFVGETDSLCYDVYDINSRYIEDVQVYQITLSTLPFEVNAFLDFTNNHYYIILNQGETEDRQYKVQIYCNILPSFIR